MDWRETLNLPGTDFPMKANLSKREPEIIEFWKNIDVYEEVCSKNKGRDRFILHDGPPYANGDIHLGTAMNKILKDIIIKYKSIRGFDCPYVPGWDCHGQPIEHEVQKAVEKRKIEVDQVEMRRMCKDYAMKFVERQSEQFERLGVRGDFGKPYLTLNNSYEATNIRVFKELWKNGIIYRGRKPIHWCPRCITALAEAEIEYHDKKSPSIYVRFPLAARDEKLSSTLPDTEVSFVIWTTTPWTLPANVALALHPNVEYAAVSIGKEILVIGKPHLESVMKAAGIEKWDELAQYKGSELKGISLKHPWRASHSVTVCAEFVDLSTGTGIVHIAPGHGQEDYEVGIENDLPMPMPVDDRGVFDEGGFAFKGVFVDKANGLIIEDLEKSGRLLGSETIEHTYAHCWRCKNPVLFRATPQWFISMDTICEGAGLRKKALEQIGETEWIPGWSENRIRSMVEGRPDWCISRQRAWGVPIPVFYCSDCGREVVSEETLDACERLIEERGADAWFELSPSEILRGIKAECGCGCSNLLKENDILDVWFESGVSHEAVLRLREGLAWPADMYLEGSDQHRGWFQSSLLAAVGSSGKAPFRSVLTHGFVVDGKGRKMSKSLGNVINPIDVCNQKGADILRLWVASSDYTVDVGASEEILLRVAEAYRRIRNTFRFILGNLKGFDPSEDTVANEEMEEIDRWILSRAGKLLKACEVAYDSYQLHQVYHLYNRFCSIEMSSLYLDMQKDCLYTEAEESKSRKSAQTALYILGELLISAISPVLTFTAEEAWNKLPKSEGMPASVQLADWQSVEKLSVDEGLEKDWEALINARDFVMREIEDSRRAGNIRSSLEAAVSIAVPEELYDLFLSRLPLLKKIFIVSDVDLHKGTGEEYRVSIRKASGKKCARCWNYSETVGSDLRHADLCDRCNSVIKGI